MANNISVRKSQILELLLKKRSGLSIDEVSSILDITRNAVQQHFSSLEKDCYITKGELKKTAGRPVQTYVLTEKGINSFPKQYAWFSELILTDLKKEKGSEDFARYMEKLGNTLSQSLLPKFEGKKTEERVGELITIMQDLGFQASSSKTKNNSEYVIKACNCIYHDLAQEHEEICEFDKALISALLDKDVELVECMAKGGSLCSFKIKNKCS
jgi:predicted ArsR family transcriptional regulator